MGQSQNSNHDPRVLRVLSILFFLKQSAFSSCKRAKLQQHRNLCHWLMLGVPAVTNNSVLRYLESCLASQFRAHLSRHMLDQYLSVTPQISTQNEVVTGDDDRLDPLQQRQPLSPSPAQLQLYYALEHLDARLTGQMEQRLTQSLDTFTCALPRLYAQLTKPVLDILLMSRSLTRMSNQLGVSVYVPLCIAVCVTLFTSVLLRALTPPFGRLIGEEHRLTGVLRQLYARLVQHAEEIAGYRGEAVEKRGIETATQALLQQRAHTRLQRLRHVILEQYLVKYVWSACGHVMIAWPVLGGSVFSFGGEMGKMGEMGRTTTRLSHVTTGEDAESVAERSKFFTVASKLLISASEALERIIASYKDVKEFSGHTRQVCEVLEVFDAVRLEHERQHLCRYQQLQPDAREFLNAPGPFAEPLSTGRSILSGLQQQQQQQQHSTVNETEEISCNDDVINFVNVQITAPNGDVILAKPLNLLIDSRASNRTHLLITGPNGSGKSSLFRLVSGLWPIKSTEASDAANAFGDQGYLLKPKNPNSIFYIPQKPYMTVGTLRDQLIYPETIEERRTHRNTASDDADADLLELLEKVHLKNILVREGGWDAERDWKVVLSGGENQRIGLARLFYHKPKFALLDECTSAIALNVEVDIYEQLKSQGITLLSITHRPSLRKFHTHCLEFDGMGDWTLTKIQDAEI